MTPSLTQRATQNRVAAALLLCMSMFPILTHAAPRTFREIVDGYILVFLNLAVTLLMILAVLAFIYGAIRFIAGSGDERARTEGKQVMIWGVLSLFFMVGIWGVVRIIYTTFFG